MTDADALLKGTQGRNGAGKFMQILLYAACSKGGCFGLRCVQEPSTWWTAKVHAGASRRLALRLMECSRHTG